jgi:hypothetical protein
MKLKKPIKKYYFGKIIHGCPYFMPINFDRNIVTIRRIKDPASAPMVRRSMNWIVELFNRYYWIQIGWPIKFKKLKLGWKDKYDTPRFEWCPAFYIYFFRWQFCIFWVSPTDDRTDKYYEQKIWLEKYSDNDYDKAKSTWPWIDGETKVSTWNDNFFEI